jgi:uncharacterized membrane protein
MWRGREEQETWCSTSCGGGVEYQEDGASLRRLALSVFSDGVRGTNGGMNLLRGVPGHPSHPPLTDVTIGAYTFATIAAVLGKLGVAEHAFAQAWWLALVVGAAASVLTVLTGLLDWLQISSGTPLKRTANLHALTNAAASVFFLLAIVLGHGDYVDRAVGTLPFVLTLVGFVLLTAGGTMGGSITYVHGMRVLNLPDEPTRRAITPLPHEEKERAAK